MTERIDLDVVVDVFTCLGVEAGLRQAQVAGAVDCSGPADVGERPRLQAGNAWNRDAAEQNGFAAGNRRRVIGGHIGGEAHQIGESVSAAVRARIRVGVAHRVGGINDIERVDIVVFRLAWLNWLTEVRMQHDVQQAAIRDAVDVRAYVDKRRLSTGSQIDHFDDAAFFGDIAQRRILRCKLDRQRDVQSIDHDLLGDDIVRRQRRRRRIDDRVLVVQDVYPRRSRKEQRPAVDVNDRDHECLS